MTDTQNTLDTPKVGDQIIVYSGGTVNTRLFIAIVEKVTAWGIKKVEVRE